MSRAVVALALAALVAGGSLGAALAAFAPARETHARLTSAAATTGGAFLLAQDYTLREACFLFASADPQRSDDLLVTGSGNVFHGCAHSNGDARVGGSDHRFDGEVRHVENYTPGGRGHELRRGNVSASASEDPWPVSLDAFEPGRRDGSPDHHHRVGDATLTGASLLPGTHYVEGDVVVLANGTELAVTIVATGNVTVRATGADLGAHANGSRVLFASRYANVTVEGSDPTLVGLVKAPEGHVALLVSGAAMEGHVAGRTVAVSGSNSAFTPLVVRLRQE